MNLKIFALLAFSALFFGCIGPPAASPTPEPSLEPSPTETAIETPSPSALASPTSSPIPLPTEDLSGLSPKELNERGYYTSIECGDEICDEVEGCLSCPADCACSNTELCSKLNYCYPKETCGDSICTEKEKSDKSCCSDCGCSSKEQCLSSGKCASSFEFTSGFRKSADQKISSLHKNCSFASQSDYSFEDYAAKLLVYECEGQRREFVFKGDGSFYEIEYSTP